MDPAETTTEDGQAEGSQLNPPAPEAAASTEPKPEDSMTLAEMNALLGKDFKDKATALKSVKDTFSYVGKRKEDIAKEVSGDTNAIAAELKQIKENLFFKDNPDYAPYRSVMAKMGSNPEEVASSTEFKGIFEKAKGYDDSQKLKSVLVSNPRIAASKDNLTKAREAMNSGDTESASKHAVAAVLATLE